MVIARKTERANPPGFAAAALGWEATEDISDGDAWLARQKAARHMAARRVAARHIAARHKTASLMRLRGAEDTVVGEISSRYGGMLQKTHL